MYHKEMGSYDEIPEGMKRYINNYGCHFNKKLCEEAISRMYTKSGAKKEKIEALTKQQVDELLNTYGIHVKRNKMYDAVYVAAMCKADFLYKSVPDEEHLAMFIRDMIDDPDATEGFIFNRFIGDCYFMNNPIEWEDILDD
jgi:hypothetical protein